MSYRKVLSFALPALFLTNTVLYGAELSVGDVTMLSGATADVVVSGTVANEITFGLTLIVEITPRVGNVGTVTFTSSPPIDIAQVGDSWPGAGTFSGFDTDSPGFSSTLNAAVDDDGRFLCDTPVSFSGALAKFPIIASSTAVGVWDVVLSTSFGDSLWECGATTLLAGTVTVSSAECVIDTDCDDLVACTDDTCSTGSCVFSANDLNCVDDTVFCNGPEVCDAVLGCFSSGDPCQPGEFCNEVASSCDACVVDGDCNDGVGCTVETCVGGSCVPTAVDANCPNDGLFCNGLESCDLILDCVSSGSPCLAGEICDEANDLCTGCTLDPECDDGDVCTDDVCNAGLCENTNNTSPCDDGLFCTATDLCSGGICVGSGDFCSPQLCDEANDTCVLANASLTAADLNLAQGATGELVVTGAIAGDSTFGVTIVAEVVTRPGNSGTVSFTLSPPSDIAQLGDPWPGAGTFNVFDTDSPGFSATLNASIDDDGSFLGAPVTFAGPLTGFGVVASGDAAGVWDVQLSTIAQDSTWEGVTTLLTSGTVTVLPTAGFSVASLAMPPASIVDVVVSGVIDGDTTSSASILLEIVGRAGNVGTLEFTALNDILEIGNPWDAAGTFSAFDVGAPGFSTALNGTVHGTFNPVPLVFSGDLSAFPVQASLGADGVWDLMLTTFAGDSTWDGVVTGLVGGTVTVTAGACLVDLDCDDADVCTDDVCVAGVCENNNNSVLCDDANPCTENDVCAAGVCAGSPTPDGNVCDDLDSCNVGETCLGGICQGALPTDCSGAGDDCNVASCDPLGAEGNCDTFVAVADGTVCDDADRCNVGETCQTGVCVGGAPIDCIPANDQCNTASCDFLGTEGNCDILTPVLDGTICDDGVACNVGEACLSGVCSGGAAPDCSGAGGQCNVASCDPAGLEGNCTILNPVSDGTVCDDGDRCIIGETCQAGVCLSGGSVDCSAVGDQCNIATCDTLGLEGNCDVLAPANEGTACDDSDLCTQNDACSSGTCVGSAIDCSFLDDACNLGICDVSNGTCRTTPFNDGGVCDDGFACTTNDVCLSGLCSGTLVGGSSVDLEWVPSTQIVQVGQVFRLDLVAKSGTCVSVSISSIDAVLGWDPFFLAFAGRADTGPFPWSISTFPNDSGLDGLNSPFDGVTLDNDGDAMYQAFANFEVGAPITPGGLVVTSFDFRALDGTVGTQVAVVPQLGLFSNTRVLGAGAIAGVDITGTLGSASLQIEECVVGLDCNDGNECTNDTCVAGVCTNVNNVLPCDDGLFCTVPDVCSNGVCVGGSDPCLAPFLCSEPLGACVQCLSAGDCDDGNLCTNNVCDAFGACQFVNNTITCDDGLFCTAVDTCSGGACVGAGDACPGAACDETADQCVECLGDLDCDDGNVCTDDVCIGNACQITNNTAVCDDNQFCTAVDLCVNGVCMGGIDPCVAPTLCSEEFDACVECLGDADCDDGNPCTTDMCVSTICNRPNNTLPCDDGTFCTATDTCSGGFCVGSGDSCPGELCDETNSRCVACFTVADCADDGVACTDNACQDGVCVFPPNDALCGDGLFCNGPETCNNVAGCLGAVSPCDDPALCVEANDSCGCQQPMVVAEGPRYIQVTPRPGNTEVALRVTGVDPEVACVSLWVQADGTLGPDPVFKRPGGVNGWQVAHVRGLEVIPSTTYTVEAQCETGVGLAFSASSNATTWLWADSSNSGAPIDISDVLLIIERFQGVLTNVSLYAVDLWGSFEPCLPQGTIEIADALRAIDAFTGLPFPCDVPCP